MNKLLKVMLLFILVQSASAQVTKKIIVEQFTNTKCSICASRNPGLNSNLDSNPQIQRISIHPSAPYSNCFLSQQNTIDNDGRTNYYGVYGSTPKLLINGTLIPTSQNYADAAMFAPFTSTSNFTIELKQFAIGNDSIQSVITVKRVALGLPTGNASMFAALVEDTVFGNGGNGENLHFNVMRRSLFSTAGQTISLPANVGDSLILSKTEKFNPIWNTSRMRTVAILQEEVNKQVIQSELSTTAQIVTSTALVDEMNRSSFSIFPNPANSYITLNLPTDQRFQMVMYNQLGAIVKQLPVVINQSRIDVSDLKNGVYLLYVFNSCNNFHEKLLVRF